MISNPPPSFMPTAGRSPSDSDIILLVNNFSSMKQKEAPNQPSNGSIAEYSMFTPYLAYALSNKVIGFADNRYSNGADNFLIEYMKYQHINGPYHLNMQNFAYAGWNTDGDTTLTLTLLPGTLSHTTPLSLISRQHFGHGNIKLCAVAFVQ